MKWSESDRRIELLAWAKQGIHLCFRESRGANMFGPFANVKAIDNSTLQIETWEEGVSEPVYWQIKLSKNWS